MTTNRKCPPQRPGKSVQEVGTPKSLITAIEHRFGKLRWDLAASHDNAKCLHYFTLEKEVPRGCSAFNHITCDALKVDWPVEGLCYLNPPFSDLAPWARKAYEESQKGAKVFLLTPLTCSRWHQKWIYGKAYILQLTPRLVFENHTASFPKDLQLAFFNSGIRGTEIWDWTITLKKHEQRIQGLDGRPSTPAQ